jgi:hypothetical protein
MDVNDKCELKTLVYFISNIKYFISNILYFISNIKYFFIFIKYIIMSGTISGIFTNILGGGLKGFQPALLGSNSSSGMEGGNERAMQRSIMREAFGNNRIIPGTPSNLINPESKTTPFRVAFNAGDSAGSYNSAPAPFLPGSNQVSSVRTLNIKSGGPHNDGTALFSGNPKFVYDGSDYTRYKKLKASNKTYNDSSFGGSNNGSYVALKRVRH